MIENPKVFISYSHDSDEHRQWVLELATKMRSHGIDVILDQWDLSLGKDLRFFMEQGLEQSSFIVCICSANYVQKANAGLGGVGYESNIISSELLLNSNADNILPIIKNNFDNRKTPIFLTNKIYANFDTGGYYDEYRKLIEKIWGESDKKKPPLGDNPFRSNLSLDIHIRNDLEKQKYISKKISGIIEFDYSKNNGIFTIGEGNFLFCTQWSACSNKEIYACSDYVELVGYKAGTVNYPTEKEILEFDYTSRVVTVSKNEIVIFENNFGNLLVIKILDIKSKLHGDESNYLKLEYKAMNSL